MTLVSGEPVPAASLGRVHLIGIGGAGMAGLARIMLGRGLAVSGSDLKESLMLTALRAQGAAIEIGHDERHLDGVDTVVVSTAIRPDNLELTAARRRGLRVLHRAAALASLADSPRVVAVAGTHGKTTTTSLLTVALQHCGADPTFYIGGQLNESGANGHAGSGDVFVLEADESDGSFLVYSPHAAIVTNVEPDHLDYYGTPEGVEKAFVAFADRIDPDGFLVACADDPGARRLAATAAGQGVRVVTYGEHPDAQVRLANPKVAGGGSVFELVDQGRSLGVVELAIPGRHNALNAAGACAVGLRLGFEPDALRAGLRRFTGARRRFEYKGSAGGVRVYDDYGHHPTELRRTLAAARGVAGAGRLIVVFQPHRYSRTAAFLDEFGPALAEADAVLVMEVYASGEDAIPGASGAAVAAGVPLPPERVVFEPSWSAVAAAAKRLARPGDLVLTLGAGDVTMIGPQLLALLDGG